MCVCAGGGEEIADYGRREGVRVKGMEEWREDEGGMVRGGKLGKK